MQSEDSAHSNMSASQLLSFPPCFPSSSIVRIRYQWFPETSCIALLQHSAILERQAYGSEIEAKEGRVVVSVSPWPGPGENPAGNESIIITTFITANKWLSPMALCISQTSQNQKRRMLINRWDTEVLRNLGLTHIHISESRGFLTLQTASQGLLPQMHFLTISLSLLRSELGLDAPWESLACLISGFNLLLWYCFLSPLLFHWAAAKGSTAWLWGI